jgi:hypothetical protein
VFTPAFIPSKTNPSTFHSSVIRHGPYGARQRRPSKRPSAIRSDLSLSQFSCELGGKIISTPGWFWTT